MNTRYQERLEHAKKKLEPDGSHGTERDHWRATVLVYKHLLKCKLPHRVIGGVYPPCEEYGVQP